MDIVISAKSQKPIYEQIYEQIAAQILNGELKPNTVLPSIRSIAKELSISIITIKNAWDMLEKNGFIYTVAGKGCFVGEYPKSGLSDKKYALTLERLKKNLPYYKGLKISLDELIEMIKQMY